MRMASLRTGRSGRCRRQQPIQRPYDTRTVREQTPSVFFCAILSHAQQRRAFAKTGSGQTIVIRQQLKDRRKAFVSAGSSRGLNRREEPKLLFQGGGKKGGQGQGQGQDGPRRATHLFNAACPDVIPHVCGEVLAVPIEPPIELWEPPEAATR